MIDKFFWHSAADLLKLNNNIGLYWSCTGEIWRSRS